MLPVGMASLQHRLDRYRTWYNKHRPHTALDGRRPEEVWECTELRRPIPIRATNREELVVAVQRRSGLTDYHDPGGKEGGSVN